MKVCIVVLTFVAVEIGWI